MARSGADGFFHRNHALRAQFALLRQQGLLAICSCAPIITPTACPRSSPIAPTTTARFSFPEKLIPVVIQSVLARKPVPVYGDGMNVRDWLYVRDHAEALWTVLHTGKLGETYNIGGHNEWANLHIVQLICDTIDEFAPQLGGNSRKLITFVTDRPGPRPPLCD